MSCPVHSGFVGIGGVTPGTPQIAPCKSDKSAWQPLICGLSLNTPEYLVYFHFRSERQAV